MTLFAESRAGALHLARRTCPFPMFGGDAEIVEEEELKEGSVAWKITMSNVIYVTATRAERLTYEVTIHWRQG